ncbi:hypothetical protein FEM48_Zijuj08G0006500 [Ziziphus jujuba var. spinosa]|uniref:Uncharacterized protein n=1 Tax=Ziziphus jujuba var. spinosa TaxID=714518 RepID=A0A978UVZ6_ZIZJJ|nr:hypothetical protein FEM48_Zijuj08G0006500 [Ziziphus jujuba var. spinosa]
MKKLTRKWRKSQEEDSFLPTRGDDPTLDDYRPLDIREQEELIRSFETSQAQQSRLWRVLLSYLSHLHSLSADCRLLIDWVAVVACSLAIIGLFHGDSKDRRQWIWYSCFFGMVLVVFWLYFMSRLPRFRWDVIWLPFGPLCGAGLSLYVDHLLSESSEEIRKLRSYMYAHKAH